MSSAETRAINVNQFVTIFGRLSPFQINLCLRNMIRSESLCISVIKLHFMIFLIFLENHISFSRRKFDLRTFWSRIKTICYQGNSWKLWHIICNDKTQSVTNPVPFTISHQINFFTIYQLPQISVSNGLWSKYVYAALQAFADKNLKFAD